MTALAVGAAVAALWVLVPAGPRLASPGRPGWLSVLGVAVGATVVVLGGSARLLVLLAVLSGAAWAGVLLWRRRAAQREAQATSALVLEGCELLAAELGVGRPPGAALERAAADWPDLAGVAEAFRVGADVPGAFRTVAGRPGAHDLRIVAAAWQVAHRTGAGLGDALHRVAADLRAGRATQRVVDGELASARATARLLAGLPVLALVMGSGTGGDPWGFLFGHPLGLACLAAGLCCALLGLWWIEEIARGVDRAP